MAAIILPFLSTLVIPGLLLSLVFIKKEEIDLLFFLIHSVIFGIAFAIISAFLLPFIGDSILPGLIFSLAVVIFLLRSKINLVKIKFSVYDWAIIFISIILLFFINNHLRQLGIDYFNPATDQYYWLAYGERSAHDSRLALHFLTTASIDRGSFFLIISHYTNLLPKNLDAYQNFILFWIFFNYFILSLTIGRLALIILPVRSLAILAPVAVFSLHWFNYYLLSTAVVPQNLGLFLFMAGFIFLNEKTTPAFTALYLIIFYLVHLATLTMFVLIVGSSKIFKEAIALITRKKESWHNFEKVSFLPAVIVAILYVLYLFNFLEFYNPNLISYYEDYSKNWNLWSQPYIGFKQNMIIWSGIVGSFLAVLGSVFYKKLSPAALPLAFALLMPWLYLTSSIIAYHAFYASWQPFRYFLIMYPAIAILALFSISAVFLLIKKFISEELGIAIIFIVMIILTPVFLTEAHRQQSFIFLDMIKGRDEGVINLEKRKNLENLLAFNKSLPKNRDNPVLNFSAPFDLPYLQWIFSPRTVLLNYKECSRRSCVLQEPLLPKSYDFFNLQSELAIVGEIAEGSLVEKEVLYDKFSVRKELGSFAVYQ